MSVPAAPSNPPGRSGTERNARTRRGYRDRCPGTASRPRAIRRRRWRRSPARRAARAQPSSDISVPRRMTLLRTKPRQTLRWPCSPADRPDRSPAAGGPPNRSPVRPELPDRRRPRTHRPHPTRRGHARTWKRAACGCGLNNTPSSLARWRASGDEGPARPSLAGLTHSQCPACPRRYGSGRTPATRLPSARRRPLSGRRAIGGYGQTVEPISHLPSIFELMTRTELAGDRRLGRSPPTVGLVDEQQGGRRIRGGVHDRGAHDCGLEMMFFSCGRREPR